MPIDIKAKDRLRMQILEKMYGAVNGHIHATVSEESLAQCLELGLDLVGPEVDYLVREGLLRRYGGRDVSLSHNGMREFEQAQKHPDEPTDHLVALNLINIESMVDSQINQGSPSASQDARTILSPLEHAQAVLSAVEDGLPSLEADKREKLRRLAGELVAVLGFVPDASIRVPRAVG